MEEQCCPFCYLSVPWGGLEHLAYNLGDAEAAPLTYSEPIQHSVCEYLAVNMKKPAQCWLVSDQQTACYYVSSEIQSYFS